METLDSLARAIAALPWILFAISLLTVACLAFQKIAGRAVQLGLSLLWLWTSLAARDLERSAGGPLTSLFAAVFALEGLLLLARGLSWGERRLEMRTPIGLSRLAGSILIAYSLALYPLLRAGGLAAADPVGVIPVSLVPLTCGLLMFLHPRARDLLFLPLLWAICGGATAFQPDIILDPGLTVSVLIGGLAVLPSNREIIDAEGDLRRETLPSYALRTRRPLGLALLGGVLATAFVGFLTLGAPPASAFPARWLGLHLALLTVVGLGYWLWLPAWMGPGFRHIAWWAACQLRLVRAGLLWWLGLWPAWLLACMIVIAAVPSLYRAAAQHDILPRQVEASLIATGIAVSLLVLLYLVYRARRRLVILGFADYTGEKELAECGKGTASRLRNELVSISLLYRTIDEALPLPTGKVVPITIGVEDPLESFHDVVGPESSLQIWKLEIPLGLLLHWLGRVAGGPRLTGSLHREGQDFVLVADYKSPERSVSWRVSSSELPLDQRAPDRSALIYHLVEGLAYRVITALGTIGSQRWEAVRAFTMGLRAYRSTQLAAADPAPDLRRAEREFIQAMEYDRTFAQCHYNLGVVYQGLQQFEAAEAEFRQIVEEDPDWREAYYALANVYSDQKSDRRAAIYARKAVEVLPFDARAWNLSGIARYALLPSSPRPDEPLSAAVKEMVEDFEISTALGCRLLFRTALRKDIANMLRLERFAASRYAVNLAIVKANAVSPGQALENSEEALRLSPRISLFPLIHGQVLFDAGSNEKSQAAFFQAFADGLTPDEQVQRWIYLLALQAQPPGEAKPHFGRVELFAYRGFLDQIAPPEQIVLGSANESGLREYERLLTETLGVLEEVKPKCPEIEPYFASCRKMVLLMRSLELGPGKAPGAATFQEPERAWVDVQIKLRRVRASLADNPESSVREIDSILETLTRTEHVRQIRRQGLYSLRARAYLLLASNEGGESRDTLVSALADAERAVAQEPESPARRWVLAEVHGRLGDLEQAAYERETALHLRHGMDLLESPKALEGIARESLSLPSGGTSPSPALRRGLGFFQQVLRLLESKWLDDQAPARQFEAHAAAHYWVGRFHLALREWEPAILSLNTACAMGFRPVDGALRLGLAYCGAGALDEAGRVFREALRRHSKARKKITASAASTPTEADEPMAEILLSWALVCSEKRERLWLACWLVREAKQLWIPKVNSARRRELRSLQHECLGRIRYRQRRFREALDELERALRLRETARARKLLEEVFHSAAAVGSLEVSVRCHQPARRSDQDRRDNTEELFGAWCVLNLDRAEESLHT